VLWAVFPLGKDWERKTPAKFETRPKKGIKGRKEKRNGPCDGGPTQLRYTKGKKKCAVSERGPQSLRKEGIMGPIYTREKTKRDPKGPQHRNSEVA